MKKQLLAGLIICNFYAYSTSEEQNATKEDRPCEESKDSQLNDLIKRLESFLKTEPNDSFNVSLENGQINLEKDDTQKESFNCQEAYSLAVLLAIMFQNKKLVPNQEKFLDFCSSSRLKLRFSGKKDSQIKITLDANITNPK